MLKNECFCFIFVFSFFNIRVELLQKYNLFIKISFILYKVIYVKCRSVITSAGLGDLIS